MPAAEGDHFFEEPEDIFIPDSAAPVEPADLVVLAIGVVVSSLCPPDLVAGDYHRHALGKQQYRGKVLDLPPAEVLDRRVGGIAFYTAVRAVVVVVAVPVSLAVCLVVLGVIGNKVIECEAVVGGDEIHAVFWSLPGGLEEVRTSRDPGGDLAHQAAVPANEAAYSVAVAPIPYRPPRAARKVAYLVEAASIPRLRYDLDIGQCLKQLYVPKQRRIGHRSPIGATRQDRALVESETVDMHVEDPELQALADEFFG